MPFSKETKPNQTQHAHLTLDNEIQENNQKHTKKPGL